MPHAERNPAEQIREDFTKVYHKMQSAEFAPRNFSPDIQAVLILSGPGYVSRGELKPNEDEPDIVYSMGRDRFRAGVAVARDIATRKKAMNERNRSVSVSDVTKSDTTQYAPLVVFNGISAENTDLREVLQTNVWQKPEGLFDPDKVEIFDTYTEDDGTASDIENTKDQIENLFQEIEDDESALYGMTRIALVSSIEHTPRIAGYTSLHNQKRLNNGEEPITFFGYSPFTREGVAEVYIAGELNKIVRYEKDGHLSSRPSELIV